MDNLKKLLEDISAKHNPVVPVYCDYIAKVIHEALKDCQHQQLLKQVSSVKYDLDIDGSLLSTTKTLYVADINGSQYTITVENT